MINIKSIPYNVRNFEGSSMYEGLKVASKVAYYLGCLQWHTRWNTEKLRRYQNQKLREIINYSLRYVPFYHRKFKKMGLNPGAINTIKDLGKLPILRRSELQKSAEVMISKEFKINSLKKVSTSGSTGQPVLTYLTDEEDALRKAKLLRANIACGQKPRDRWAVITAPLHQAVTYRLQKLLGVYLPIPVSVFDDTATQISQIEKIGPDVLDGYSSSLLLLAKEIRNRGVKTVEPKIIVGGAELIDGSSRRFIENVFNAPFYDEYACSEFERLAWQCKEKNGYHIDADSVIMQFVDENGEEVSPGESGEIVCTSLFNYAMPLIRYATGDVGKASDEHQCPCGRTFPLMKIIEGRKDSLVILPDGRVLSALTLGWMMEFYRFYNHIEQYRVIQKKADLFKFIIKKTGNVDERAMEIELHNHVRKMLQINESEVALEIEFVDSIPLDKGGKLRKIISELTLH